MRLDTEKEIDNNSADSLFAAGYLCHESVGSLYLVKRPDNDIARAVDASVFIRLLGIQNSPWAVALVR